MKLWGRTAISKELLCSGVLPALTALSHKNYNMGEHRCITTATQKLQGVLNVSPCFTFSVCIRLLYILYIYIVYLRLCVVVSMYMFMDACALYCCSQRGPRLAWTLWSRRSFLASFPCPLTTVMTRKPQWWGILALRLQQQEKATNNAPRSPFLPIQLFLLFFPLYVLLLT